MKTKYLTLRAELVEGDNTDADLCEKCIFVVDHFGGFFCGIDNYQKRKTINCNDGYWKEIDLTK